MGLRNKVSVIIKNNKEAREVLKALEKEGYEWQSGIKATQYVPSGMHHISVRGDKKLTFGISDKFRDFEECISAKEFLRKNDCIVVYRNDEETVALDKVTGKKAVAKCHPDDEYDFYTGAKLAFERLTGGTDQKEQPKQLYNGKVVCVDNKFNKSNYTVGKIYQFEDGVLTDDNGYQMETGRKIYTFEDWEDFTSSEFIEVVE